QQQMLGFQIAGEDRIFHWATEVTVLAGNQIQVSADRVRSPVAVRYGWADNPRCNVRSGTWLSLPPFRTDTWPRNQDSSLLHPVKVEQ
ncbi:MAG: hypothetical protein KDA96_04205, partial [Planctomycetaceae bacterium]|nr:hypothetical protein [Planctomycetaceae bacterium]